MFLPPRHMSVGGEYRTDSNYINTTAERIARCEAICHEEGSAAASAAAASAAAASAVAAAAATALRPPSRPPLRKERLTGANGQRLSCCCMRGCLSFRLTCSTL